MQGEILRFVQLIHTEKEIEKEAVFLGLEASIRSALAKKWGGQEASVTIDRSTGEVLAYVGEKQLDQAQIKAEIGRLAAQTGKQVLLQKIRVAAREVIYEEFSKKIGTIVTGFVQRFEGRNIIVSLGKVEGLLPRGEQVRGERFRINGRMRAYVQDVRKEGRQVRALLSRRDPCFVNRLFHLEVPEVRDGTIEIVNIAREPGVRTKVAVRSPDADLDCVGACVGVQGSRVKSIKEELFGEKIEIVKWDDTVELYIMNALKPAGIVSIDLDYDQSRARVYVTADQQSLTIGKRGQNVRLASALTHWELDIVSVSQEDIQRLRTEDVEEGQDIGQVVGSSREDETPYEPAKQAAQEQQTQESSQASQATEATEATEPTEPTGQTESREVDEGTGSEAVQDSGEDLQTGSAEAPQKTDQIDPMSTSNP